MTSIVYYIFDVTYSTTNFKYPISNFESDHCLKLSSIVCKITVPEKIADVIILLCESFMSPCSSSDSVRSSPRHRQMSRSSSKSVKGRGRGRGRGVRNESPPGFLSLHVQKNNKKQRGGKKG